MQESGTVEDADLGAQQVHGATPGKLFTICKSVSHQSRGPCKKGVPHSVVRMKLAMQKSLTINLGYSCHCDSSITICILY